MRQMPGPGQESVWDYPRPPRLDPTDRLVRVEHRGVVIAESRRTIRVLETSHPPVYYVPLGDCRPEYLVLDEGSSFCEFKGRARYYAVRVGNRRVSQAAWYYPNPEPGFEAIRDFVAFYPGKVDSCYVDGEKVRPQAGGFYGGWITNEVVGPFKGERGTEGW